MPDKPVVLVKQVYFWVTHIREAMKTPTIHILTVLPWNLNVRMQFAVFRRRAVWFIFLTFNDLLDRSS